MCVKAGEGHLPSDTCVVCVCVKAGEEHLPSDTCVVCVSRLVKDTYPVIHVLCVCQGW